MDDNCGLCSLSQCCCCCFCAPCDDVEMNGGWGASVGPTSGGGGNSSSLTASKSVRSTNTAADHAVEIKAGLCNADPITKQGKRIQMAQMLCVPLLPIIILIVQVFLSLVDSANDRVSKWY